MSERGRRSRFSQQALGTARSAACCANDFQGNRPAQPEIFRPIDVAHGARSEPGDDTIAGDRLADHGGIIPCRARISVRLRHAAVVSARTRG
jgi:hypothetical protein